MTPPTSGPKDRLYPNNTHIILPRQRHDEAMHERTQDILVAGSVLHRRAPTPAASSASPAPKRRESMRCPPNRPSAPLERPSCWTCAATSGTYRAVPPASMRRQIRRTGRIFFILLIICNDIFVSFHPLVQDEVDNTFVTECSERSLPRMFLMRTSFWRLPAPRAEHASSAFADCCARIIALNLLCLPTTLQYPHDQCVLLVIAPFVD